MQSLTPKRLKSAYAAKFYPVQIARQKIRSFIVECGRSVWAGTDKVEFLAN